ncbi:MAG: hypothetical protein KIS91_17420, partial [Anaerolineae bacterium]|nr:hypothetical protein [Anaerolineae bacterium]
MKFTRLAIPVWAGLFFAHVALAQVPTIEVHSAGSPVVSARCWTQAVGQRPDGGYTFIAQYFNHQSKLPNAAPEWVLIDLETGKQQVFNLPGYSNSNYQQKNCLRAANGRIFFSASGGHIHYYDPPTNSMKTLGSLLPDKSGYSFFYRLEFGPDGMLYATTQSSNRRTALARIDPNTLEHKVWFDLGDPERKDGLTYGYYHQADPPWVYIGVGQNIWRLVALNTETGEHRVLGTPTTWVEL